MRLYIAEKPSVAKAIAAELGQTGRGDGFIECGADKITWCFGHMFEQAEPDEYTPEDVPRGSSGKKIWRIDDLPIIPKLWILHPKDDAKKQLAVIGKLIKEAKEIVHAGDPDREGCLLVDDVLNHFGNKKPVLRFWVSAQDSVTIKRGLAALKDNKAYAGWSDAARGRQRADWLIGMNLSRAFTLRAQRGGTRALLTVGRVQTPTLALVVMRDREIENFKPIAYHTIRATIEHKDGKFFALWDAKADQTGLDPEGRLIDTNIANEIVANVIGKPGEIGEYKQEAKHENQPLAFSLSDITVLASARYGYGAEAVLNACQALYETHKLTSYPRTDCAYLPETQHADASRVLEAVAHLNPELATLVSGTNTAIKSATWNDEKITAHHGIIPTMHKGSKVNLSEPERNIYQLIVYAYLAQFYPIHEFMSTTVTILVAGESFKTRGKVVTKNGWRDILKVEDHDEDEETQSLPAMKRSDKVACLQAVRRDAKTKPPSRFSEGTLGRAMENIHKYVTDPEHKKLLRDGDGIGTSATRASIITDLSTRKFLEAKGKQIVSTTLGRSMIDALPEVVKSPVLTAIYERMLKGIEQGTTELTAFVAKQEKFIVEQVAKANDGAVTISGGKEATPISSLHKCLACGSGLSRREIPKKKGSFWWGCSNYPTCKQTYTDLKGRPDFSKGKNGSTT